MEFIANYWVILIVVFILFLLVLLSYLIDKEIRNMKDGDLSKVEEGKVQSVNKVKDNINSNADLENTFDDTENIVDESRELDYDELDVDDIDEEFNRLIHKKKIIDESIIDSVEAMHIDDISIEENMIDTNIELPEIKIKKDINEDIW